VVTDTSFTLYGAKTPERTNPFAGDRVYIVVRACQATFKVEHVDICDSLRSPKGLEIKFAIDMRWLGEEFYPEARILGVLTA